MIPTNRIPTMPDATLYGIDNTAPDPLMRNGQGPLRIVALAASHPLRAVHPASTGFALASSIHVLLYQPRRPMQSRSAHSFSPIDVAIRLILLPSHLIFQRRRHKISRPLGRCRLRDGRRLQTPRTLDRGKVCLVAHH